MVEDAEAKETESLPSGTPSLEEGQSCVNHQTPWPIVSLVKGRECSERVQRWEGTLAIRGVSGMAVLPEPRDRSQDTDKER